MRISQLPVLLTTALLLSRHATIQTPHYVLIHRLQPKEGVFAYARISPDGKRLAYSSQITARPITQDRWTVTLIDLVTHKMLYRDLGVDAFWSNDGKRIIYSGNRGVTIWNSDTGMVSYAPEASALGDYFSWSVRDGKDLILTILNNYYYLSGDKPLLPPGRVPSCDKIGTGERPLISKDGTRITTFVKGNLVVRGLDNCDNILQTGIQGAKADFSWDGRYIAFHALKKEGRGYEIRIVDLEQHTVRVLPGLEGSGFFPSWTRDGRLFFHYDAPDFRGFIMASDVLATSAVALPSLNEPLPDRRAWTDIFPETPAEPEGTRLVMIWAPWSAHSFEALMHLQEAHEYFTSHGIKIDVMAAADPSSLESDITRQLDDFQVTVPRIPLSMKGLRMTEARNQMPTTLLFQDGILIDCKLGAQTFDVLREWITEMTSKVPQNLLNQVTGGLSRNGTLYSSLNEIVTDKQLYIRSHTIADDR